uniref:Uncharacterized protein n=1 Tax=Glossina pallidipes TaxID=7398 RepID=A0A1B0A1C5_GLOPL
MSPKRFHDSLIENRFNQLRYPVDEIHKNSDQFQVGETTIALSFVGAFVVVGASAFYSTSIFVSAAALPVPTNRVDLCASTISAARERSCFSHTKAVAIFLRTSTATDTGVRCAGFSALFVKFYLSISSDSCCDYVTVVTLHRQFFEKKFKWLTTFDICILLERATEAVMLPSSLISAFYISVEPRALAVECPVLPAIYHFLKGTAALHLQPSMMSSRKLHIRYNVVENEIF